MDLFIVVVEFEAGKNLGQIWKFFNLNLIQVFELHESFSLRILRESNIYIHLNNEQSKRISIDEFIFNL